MNKEEKFFNSLRQVFVGVDIEGEGGFINLMRMKSNYYSQLEMFLINDINDLLKDYSNEFRNEVFDKLFDFFSRYFTSNGSLYFDSTPFHNNIYEKVYTDEKDVILFWKTQMLYYVKTDHIFKSMPIILENLRFYFDVSKLEYKKSNEKKSLIYELDKSKEKDTIKLFVKYSTHGRKTDTEGICKELSKLGFSVNEEILEKATSVFEKQNEVDYFINKNAKQFLQEQFKLWNYQYYWDGAKEWDPTRVNQLQVLKSIAFRIIEIISQFENELVKIWNKPKFVKNSNYVISIDKIADEGLKKKIINSPGIYDQINEWEELDIVMKGFKPSDLLSETNGKLPIDTKYFKVFENEIIESFDDIDNQLDGWLIKSDNYQALNTILPKFKGKVQTIFIDPPFNKAESEQFSYVANYKDSSWLTMLENRLSLAKSFLTSNGTIFVNSDDKCNTFTRFLLDQTFGVDNFQNEIIWCYEKPGAGIGKFKNNHSNIFLYSLNKEFLFNTLYVPRKGEKKLTKREGRHATNYLGKISPDWWVDMWTDIPSFATAMTAGERSVKMLGVSFPTQMPEKLLHRVVHTGSNENDYVMDFFGGTGVTAAVAHKMGRKWISVENGDQFSTIILPRLKKVVAYDKSGISKDLPDYIGGGFFKYYELEQYEETLSISKYSDSDLLSYNINPYENYIFLKDEKLLDALELDFINNQILVNLDKLYKNIDIGESVSNITGIWQRKINTDVVQFTDGADININSLNFNHIRPLIWWDYA